MELKLVAKVENKENEGLSPTKRTRCEVYSRVVGYLRPVNQWNDGKQEEFRERKYVNNL